MSNAARSAHAHRSIDLGEISPFEKVAAALEKQFDPFGMTTSVLNAQFAWLTHPQELARAINALSGDILALQAHLARRALGIASEDVVTPHPGDTRFVDPVWQDSATWDIVKESYLALTHRLEDMCYETPGLSDKARRRAAFWVRKWLNAVAPTNFFLTNPVALRKFSESGGASLRQGANHFLRDYKEKNVLMVEEDAFTVGGDLATTPGQVVFRNRLVELLHYAPSTEQAHKVPLVIITPWINKYYILDLTPKKSLVRWLTEQGFQVYITSWKNPGVDMADLTFDDYLLEGIDATVNFVKKAHKVPQVAITGYCIGGTLLSTYMAWANRRYGASKMPIACWSLFTTLTDFANPGDIEVFIDEGSISWLEQSMAKKGYLDGGEMATSFRMLRSNSLIWHYFVSSYLYGEALPPFDVLFWNMDSTRMPQAMHSYYLREMYLHNKLIKRDALNVAGEDIDLGCITQPLYAVSAEDDHIAPWQQCYRIRRYISAEAPMRFVLSTSGHILGIVNPPVNPPKRSFWAGSPTPGEHAEHWKQGIAKTPGSWWHDWVEWLQPHCGPLVTPLAAKPDALPRLGAAPGTYVFEK